MIDLRYGVPCLESLRDMPDQSVHCVCTSPPYWGLRDYKTPAQIWGGAMDCDHKWTSHLQPAANGIIQKEGMTARTLSASSATRKPKHSAFCSKCNAWRGHLGLEPTPEMFVANLVTIFREVWRVLRDDGTLWLNLGDSFASGKGTCFNPGGGEGSLGHTTNPGKNRKANGIYPLDRGSKATLAASGLKSKDLVGIPWRVAFALQADGWYLRSDIIWAKPNPMPESVIDRPTKSHEYIFLLTKNARYFYDSLAIQEPSITKDTRRTYGSKGAWDLDGRSTKQHPQGKPRKDADGLRRNRRTIWNVATKPFKGAHFAVFPPKLVEPCIRGGTSEHGCCVKCGAPWKRMVEKHREHGIADQAYGKTNGIDDDHNGHKRLHRRLRAARAAGEPHDNPLGFSRTVGWRPTCQCNAEVTPCVVLDPFSGSGTTCKVASDLGRDAIGLDLSKAYLPLAQQRCGMIG